jgi:hypothetical protein
VGDKEGWKWRKDGVNKMADIRQVRKKKDENDCLWND